MKFLKTLAGHLYFSYALLVFAALMFVVIIPVLLVAALPKPKDSQALHGIFRVWMGVYMPLVFCPVFRRGKSNFKKGENYIVVCNHNSFADVPVSSPWIPGANKTLAKVEMSRIPIFGIIYRAGAVLVDRRSDQSRRESFAAMQQALNTGLHLCLYPEGTRNKSGKPLQPFFDGAFKTAIKAQKDIIPALIFNTGRIMPHYRKFWARPLPVRIHFLPAVSVQGLALTDTAALKQKVHEIMERYYVENLG